MIAALVLGGAACLWDDLRDIGELVGGEWPGLVIAVNDSGHLYPGRVDHWVSLHPSKLHADESGDTSKGWRALREANGYPNGYVTWGGRWITGSDDSQHVDRVIPVVEVGSSGLHAVMVALELGCERIVLAGVPMDAQRHIVRQQAWDVAWFHRKGWVDAAPKIEGHVRSMSGWTREKFGEVTREFLELPAEGLTKAEVAAMRRHNHVLAAGLALMKGGS